ncbi:MAG: hypothetical protein JWO47_164 [Candidatus Saccharibacteria bacterium]|nr:hypothetical protein [Candidatus Saccharibacteria bacterium]
MSLAEQARGEWAVDIGFDEHVAASSGTLRSEGAQILDAISIETVLQSTYHPNGFLVTKYKADETGQRRLHIWPTTRDYNMLPHTHPWHMASLVLAGTYIEFLPAVELVEKSDYELMVPSYNAAHQQVGVQSTGRAVKFWPGRYHHYDAGEIHTLPAGAFHSTLMPEKHPVLTLVSCGPQLFDNPHFVRDTRSQPVAQSLEADRPHPNQAEAEIIWAELQTILP